MAGVVVIAVGPSATDAELLVARQLADSSGLPLAYGSVIEANGNGKPGAGAVVRQSIRDSAQRPHLGDVLVEER